MKKILFCCLFFWANVLSAQSDLRIDNTPSKIKFFFEILNFYSFNDKQSRMDIFVQVPYSNLQFIKQNDVFSASYEVNIDVFNSQKQLEVQKTYIRTLPLKAFNETISKQNYDLSQKSINLKPGKYNVEITVTDNDSRKYLKVKKIIEMRDFSLTKVSISDLMLLSKLSVIDNKRTMIPNISGNVGNLEGGFNIFFEIYSNEILNDSANIVYAVLSKSDKIIYEKTIKQYISEITTPVFIKIDNPNLVFGDYKLIVKVTSEKKTELFDKVGLGRLFLVRWEDMPVNINDLNIAVQQMQYIATQTEIDSILEADGDKAKQKKFLEFWKNRRPTMEEYYARVDYANEHFKVHREGWRTDMGMVFIIFGIPDNIERHPFELESVPYEVWDYYTINRRFIFVDEAGFGEYRLLNPIWDKNIRVH